MMGIFRRTLSVFNKYSPIGPDNTPQGFSQPGNLASMPSKNKDTTDENTVLEPNRSKEKYFIVPHEGSVEGLYHGHSEFSDGVGINELIDEALKLDLNYLGIIDHLDLTGISEQEHQSPELGNFSDNMEFRKLCIEENNIIDRIDQPLGHGIGPEYNTIEIAKGAEIDWDPRNPGKLTEEIRKLDTDYEILSVHHDKEGTPIKSPQILQEADIEEKVQEYVQNNVEAIEAGGQISTTKAIAHPARAEEGVLNEAITEETYEPIIEAAAEEDIAYEINGKVYLRYFLNNGELPTEFKALANYEGELPDISVGTDTHRVGRSQSYKDQYETLTDIHFSQREDFSKGYLATESQMRLQFMEDVLTKLTEERGEEVTPVTLLEDANTTEVYDQQMKGRAIEKSA